MLFDRNHTSLLNSANIFLWPIIIFLISFVVLIFVKGGPITNDELKYLKESIKSEKQERIDFIEDYDFKEIISKYDLNENYIIFIIFQDKDNFKSFSKFNINSVKSNFKKEFKLFQFKDEEKIKELIKIMKIRYDDEWKKINLINSSIKLNIHLNIDSKNIAFIEKIEKILSEIELIENYYISYFNNKITSYLILSNSTPNKLINEFKKFNIKVSTENNIWTLNE